MENTTNANRMAWFESAKFGMCIHWGLYAFIGRGERVMNREMIPMAEYEKLANRFAPKDFDPPEMGCHRGQGRDDTAYRGAGDSGAGGAPQGSDAASPGDSGQSAYRSGSNASTDQEDG